MKGSDSLRLSSRTAKVGNSARIAVFLAALMVMSVVALGFLAPAAAVAENDSELGTASIEGTTTDSTFSPLNYAANDGNSAFVDTDGLSVAINDWRNDNIETQDLLDVINLWRSGESLMEVHFEDQDSIGGDAVEVAEAFVSEDVADEYIVGIEDEDGELLSTSSVLSGTETEVEISDLNLDVEVGDTEENLTAVLHEVDDGDPGDAFTAEGERITDTATVTVILEGLFVFNDTYTELDAKIASGESANVTVGVNAVSEVDINGTITLVDSDFEEIEEREVGPGKDEELFVEEFELNTSDLETGENFTYTVLVETEETPEVVESRDGTILVQGLSLTEQALGEDNSEDAIIVEEVYAEENQTIEVRDDVDDVVGSTELSENLSNESAVVEVTTDAGEHTAVLLDEEGEEVTADDGDIYGADLSFADQTYQSSTDEVIVETADLMDGTGDDTTFTIDLHPTDENGTLIPDEAVGQSGNLTGANTDVPVPLDENATASDDYVAMIHLGESAEPLDTDPLLAASDGALAPVVDPGKVTIVEGETGELDAPESADRMSEITVSTVVTAQEVMPEGDDEVDIEARYIFDGEQEDSQTVTLGAGENETVEFNFTLPGSLTAGEDEVEHSIETDETEASANLTLTNSIQTAVDYASAGDTVDIEEGTYEESVMVDVEDLTIEPQSGADVTVDSGNETAFDLYADGITIDGLTLVGAPGPSALVNAADLGDDDAYTLVNNAFESNSEATGVLVGSGELTAEDNTLYGLTAGLGGIGVEGSQATVDIVNNTFTEIEQDAIGIGSDGADGEITYNDFENNGEGVKIFESVGDEGVGDLSVNYNNFEGNDFGVENNASEYVNATLNWWGDESGPSGAGPGVGDAVSEYVEFDPWLDAPHPDGEPVTDQDWQFAQLEGDSDVQRGGDINLSATVQNSLQPASLDDNGREVEVKHVLEDGDGNLTVLNSKNVSIVAGGEERVNFTSQVPQGPDEDFDAEHRMQVEDEFRGKEVNISQGFGDIEGTVTASGETAGLDTPGTDEGIENVTITVEKYAYADENIPTSTVTFEDATDADGEYELPDLPVGDHSIEVEDPDGEFVGEERATEVLLNQSVEENFALNYSEGGSISGEIELDEVDPSEDVTVTVEADDSDSTYSTTVDINGTDDSASYELLGVDVNVDDGYTVTASADNYAGDEVDEVEVDVGAETEDVNLSLERETGTIAGTVTASGETTPEGTPGTDEGIADANVTVFGFANDTADDQYWYSEVQTEEDGSYEVEDVPVTTESMHFVEVEADDFTTMNETEVSVDANETTEVDFALDYAEAGSISGEVELDTVDPAEDVDVMVEADDGDSTYTTNVTAEGANATAAYDIDGVDVNVDDGYTVTASAANHSDGVEEEVEVDVGAETEDVNLTLERDTGTIAGTATAAEEGFEPQGTDPIGPNDPIENVTVELFAFQDDDTPYPVANTTTDEDGEYSFEEVPVTTESTHFVAAVDREDFSAPAGENVTVAANETTTVDIGMLANEIDVTLDGFLDTGAPHDDFEVTYELEGPDDLDRTRTRNVSEGDTDVPSVGFLDLTSLEPDETYNVTVSAEGYDAGMNNTYVEPGSNATITATATAQNVSVEADPVKLNPGSPESGLEMNVELFGPDGLEDSNTFLVDEDEEDLGSTSFENVPPLEINDDEEYNLTVILEEPENSPKYTVNITERYVAPGQTEVIPVTLFGPIQIGDDYYATIQDAVDAAEDDDIIEIGNGTYVEDVTVPAGTDDLTLESAGNVTLAGNLTVNANETTTTGFTIEGDYEDNGQNNELVDSTVTSTSPGGVVTLSEDSDGGVVENVETEHLVVAGTDAHVSNSTIDASEHDAEAAVEVTGAGLTVESSTLTNELEKNENVVYIDHGASGETTLVDNEITAVSGFAEESGEVETASTLIADGNTFSEETTEATLTHGIRGVDAYAAGSEVLNNEFGEMTTGVQFSDADDVTVHDNEFTDIWGSAVLLSGDVTDATVTENNFTSTGSGVGFLASGETIEGDLAVNDNNFVDVGDEPAPEHAVFVADGFGSGDDGLDNAGTAAVDEVNATANWWGDRTGPGPVGPGLGATVTEGVDFNPWLDDEFPAGDLVTDEDFEVDDFESDDTDAERGDTISASANVTNNLVEYSPEGEEPGRDVDVEYVLVNEDDEDEILDEQTVKIVPDTTELVEMEGTIEETTTALDEEGLEQEIRIADEPEVNDSAAINVSHSIQAAVDYAGEEGEDTVTVREGTYEESVTAHVEDLTIEAAEGAAPTVDADGQEAPAFIIDATTTLEGLEILGDVDEDTIDAQAALTVNDSSLTVSIDEPTSTATRAIDVSDELTVEYTTLSADATDAEWPPADEYIQLVSVNSGEDVTVYETDFEGDFGDGIQLLSAGATEVKNSTFAGDGDYSVAVNVGGAGDGNTFDEDITVTQSEFEDLGMALNGNVADDSDGELKFIVNNLAEDIEGLDLSVDPNAGVRNADPVENAQVNATFNWWGNETGPSGEEPGVPVGADGTGASVSEGVDFEPWLNDTFQNAGQVSHTDDDVTVEFVSSDDTGVREETISATVDITNEVETDEFAPEDDGRLVTVEYIVDDEVIDETDEFVIANDTETVVLEGTIPNSTLAAPDEDNNREEVGQTVRITDAAELDNEADAVLNVSNPIQQAVDTAGEGGTATALGGTYSENVEIPHADLTLTAEDAGDLPTLQADNTDEAALEIMADDVTLSYFNVEDGDEEGILVSDGDGVTIDATSVEEFDTGLSASPSSAVTNLTVDASEFTENDVGISADSDAELSVNDSMVADSDDVGISVSGAEVSVSESTIANNGNQGILGQGSTVDVTDSVVENNDLDGIRMTLTGDLSVDESELTGNDRDGLAVRDSVGSVTNSTIEGSDDDGILVQDDADVDVSNSTIEANDIGLVVSTPESDTFANVSVNESSLTENDDGVRVRTSDANVTVTWSDIEDNERGVFVTDDGDGDNVTVIRNNIVGNSDFGVENDGTGDVNATQVWWGDESGPSGDPVGADGTGDEITEGVLFEPWLDDRVEDADDEVSDDGFAVEFDTAQTDTEGERNTQIDATVDVTNLVETSEFSPEDDGREVAVTYEIEGETVDEKTVYVIANQTKSVDLSGDVPNSTLAAPPDNLEETEQTVVIDPAGNDTTSDTIDLDVENPIQQAVDTAGEDGTATALGGTYSENVEIVDDLTLTAYDANDRPVVTPADDSEPVIGIADAEVTVESFDVEGGDDVGIGVGGSADVTIYDVSVSDAGVAGIGFDDDEGPTPGAITATVTNSYITDNGAGIGIETGTAVDDITVNDNNIVDNVVGIENNEGPDPWLDATNNWWGDEDGPDEAGLPGEGGDGDTVSDRASTEFGLWLDAPFDEGGEPVAGGRDETVIASGDASPGLEGTAGPDDPIENVTVEVFTYTDSPDGEPFTSTKTDDTGSFTFSASSLPVTEDIGEADAADNHVLRLSKSGFATKTVNVSVEDGELSSGADIKMDYDSIQTAIDEAQDGDFISIDAGTFEEDVEVFRDDLTLEGEGQGETKIVGNVTVTGDDNTIRDLTIQGDYDDQGSGNDKDSVSVTSASPGGTVTLAGDSGSLSNVTVDDSVDADGPDYELEGTTVEETVEIGADGDRTSVSASRAGEFIVDENAEDVVTEDLTVARATVDEAGELADAVDGEPFESADFAGDVTIEEGGTITVADGTYETSLSVAVEGLTLEGAEGAEPTVLETGITDGGVIKANADSVTVDGLDIAGNADFGIDMRGEDGTVSDVTIEDTNLDNGVGTNAAGLTVEDSEISDVDDAGIFAPKDDLTVQDTEIENTRAGVGGIATDEPATVTIEENEFTDIAEDAIGIGGDIEADSEISENEFTDVDVGVEVFPDGDVGELTVTDNDFAADDVGVEVDGDADGTLDATENFWGADNGPSGDVVDAETDEPAAGDGAELVDPRNDGDGDIRFDPFLDGEGDGVGGDGFSVEFVEDETPAEAEREDPISPTVEVTNELDFSPDQVEGAEVTVIYELDGEDAQEQVTVTADDSEQVTFDEFEVPGSTTAAAEDNREGLTQEVTVKFDETEEASADTGLDVTNPIQQAIDFADAEDEDEVEVLEGEYEESVTVDVEGLTLEAADGASPTIDAGGSSGTVVGIEAAVRVEGFTIQNFAQNGMTIFGSANGAEVVDNTVDTSSVSKATSYAINTDDGGAENLLIKNNELGYGQTGSLQLNQNSEVTVEGNTISSAQGGGSEVGIVVGSGSEITITDNTISDATNGIQAGSGVIPGVSASLDDLDINSNDITDNDDGVVIAELENSVTSVSINENNLQSNSDNGVRTVDDPLSETVDATNNWWGDASGPSGGVEDPETGAVADGDGAEIVADDNVKFDPWLDAPGGDPVESGDIEIDVTDSPAEAERGDQVEVTVDVERPLVSAEATDDGSEYQITLTLDNFDGSSEEIATKTISLVPGEEQTGLEIGDDLDESTTAVAKDSDESELNLEVEIEAQEGPADSASDDEEIDVTNPIQQAVEFAGTDSDLSTVEVLDGEYEENVVISSGLDGVDDLSGLEVTAADGASPEVVFEPDSADGVDDETVLDEGIDAGDLATVEIYAEDVEFNGIDVTRNAAEDRGADDYNTQGVTVRNSGVLVEDITIGTDLGDEGEDNNNSGVFVSDEGSPTENVELSGVTTDNFEIGVLVSDFYGGAIDGVSFDDVDATASEDVGLAIIETEDGDGITDVTGDDEFEEIRTNQEIQTAVTLAEPNTDATVEVLDGEYEESVTVDVEGLTLEAAEEGAATIEGTGEDNLIRVIEDDVTIDGFAFEATDVDHVIDIGPNTGEGGVGTTVQNVDIDGGDNTGVLVRSEAPSDVAVTDSVIEDARNGVLINEGTDHEVSDNEIQDAGNAAVNLGTAETDENTITGNTFENAVIGLEVFGQPSADDNIIDNNTFVAGDNTEQFVLDEDEELDLNAIADGNDFDPEDPVVGDDRIVPPVGDNEVLNLNTGERFTEGDVISNAEDAAGTDETLLVGSGTYEESVSIGTEGLTLESVNGADETTIDADGDEIDVFGGDFTTAVAITADDVEVDDFTVEGADNSVTLSRDGLDPDGEVPEDVEVRNNVLEDGVGTDGGADITIDDNTINSAVTLFQSDAEITDNDITVDDDDQAIRVNFQGSDVDVDIEDNTLNIEGDLSTTEFITDDFHTDSSFFTLADLQEIAADNDFQADGEEADEAITQDTSAIVTVEENFDFALQNQLIGVDDADAQTDFGGAVVLEPDETDDAVDFLEVGDNLNEFDEEDKLVYFNAQEDDLLLGAFDPGGGDNERFQGQYNLTDGVGDDAVAEDFDVLIDGPEDAFPKTGEDFEVTSFDPDERPEEDFDVLFVNYNE